MDQYLQSTESLDRSSPELWPRRTESLCQDLLSQDGVGGISHSQQSSSTVPSPVNISDKDFTAKDMKLFHEYAALSSSQIVDVVKQMQNVAYLLGLEEAKEMRRGKYLNILRRTNTHS